MKRIKITREKAIAAMEAAVAERGEDFTFESMFGDVFGCFYSGVPYEEMDSDVAPEEVPACLVGWAFNYIDPDAFGFLATEGRNEEAIAVIFGVDRTMPSTAPEENIVRTYGYEIVATRKALMVLTAAQDCQDRGGSWGLALRRAKDVEV